MNSRQAVVTVWGSRTRYTLLTSGDGITRYARRMTIAQRLAEIIRAFHADAVLRGQPQRRPRHHALRLAQALLAALGARLPGVTPDRTLRYEFT